MKKIGFIIGFVFLAHFVFAQYEIAEPQENWRSKFHFGGGLGLSFGTVTQVDLSPSIAYDLTNRLSVGVGASYLYYKNKIYSYETSVFGFGLYADFAVVKNLSEILPIAEGTALTLHAEANYLNLDPNMDFLANPPRTERFWLCQPFVGAGIKIPAGKKAYVLLLFMYNLNEKPYSPYANPSINVKFMF